MAVLASSGRPCVCWGFPRVFPAVQTGRAAGVRPGDGQHRRIQALQHRMLRHNGNAEACRHGFLLGRIGKLRRGVNLAEQLVNGQEQPALSGIEHIRIGRRFPQGYAAFSSQEDRAWTSIGTVSPAGRQCWLSYAQLALSRLHIPLADRIPGPLRSFHNSAGHPACTLADIESKCKTDAENSRHGNSSSFSSTIPIWSKCKQTQHPAGASASEFPLRMGFLRQHCQAAEDHEKPIYSHWTDPPAAL